MPYYHSALITNSLKVDVVAVLQSVQIWSFLLNCPQFISQCLSQTWDPPVLIIWKRSSLRLRFITAERARSDLTARAWQGKVRCPGRTYELQLADFPFGRRRSTPVSELSFFYFILSIHFFAKTMTNLEPLKSAISFLAVEDTSLALPSSNQYRSGQQRVLEQVQTMRMHKSRHSSHGSGSPTSKKRNLVSQFCSAILCI